MFVSIAFRTNVLFSVFHCAVDLSEDRISRFENLRVRNRTLEYGDRIFHYQ